jgi:hypothetical protein
VVQDEEEEVLPEVEKPAVTEKPKPKKPAGAVSMFGGVDPFGAGTAKGGAKKTNNAPKKKGMQRITSLTTTQTILFSTLLFLLCHLRSDKVGAVEHRSFVQEFVVRHLSVLHCVTLPK